jgi:thioredoxin reductase (NADPH)
MISFFPKDCNPKEEHLMYDIVIIGGGAAGITAAIYALRAGMNTILIEKMGVGGQIILTEAVENYPGFPFISGPDLMERFEKHAEKFGLQIKYEEAERIESEGNMHRVITDEGSYETRAVIIATGSVPRKLSVPGEENLIGKGVSFCAVCDGPFFKEKEVAVIGGGDAAVKEAIYLTQIVNKVRIVHRRDKLRAEKILQEQAFDNPKIEFIWNHVVDSVIGDNRFEGILIKDVHDPGKTTKLDVAAVFVYIGHIPNTKFLDVKKTETGLILTFSSVKTSVPGIFAAGDCRDTCLRQIATCVGDGALAAYFSGEYVEKLRSGKPVEWKDVCTA